ncbi:uncharacterized protein [Bactrocera oleae]|uniref:uncharacterized protein isoform X3 n=1 Tax=Bactrocera oleae TaxID=104688 RepID=UPI00387E9F1E
MSSHSVVSLSSFNILFFTQVLTVLTSSIKYHEYVTDKGKNISIPCTAEGNVMWVKESGNNSTIIQTGKFLVLTNVSTDERGLYVCFAAVPPRQASAPNTGSNAQATNEQRKSITASLPTSASPTTASSLILTSTSSSSTSSSSEDINVSTMVHMSAANASTTSSLPMPVPTIAVATATNANTNANTVNISTAQQVSKADKATTLNNSGQTMKAPTPDTARKTEANNGNKSEEETEAEEYQAVEKVNLTVRTPPGPVTQLYFKASTILGFLIWRFNKTNSGGYPVRSFTAEFRNVSYNETPYNQSFEHEWSRMDPINIAPNVRQMEVYRLEPNTTYEFRIWANNQLGSGEVVTTNVTTLPETKEEVICYPKEKFIMSSLATIVPSLCPMRTPPSSTSKPTEMTFKFYSYKMGLTAFSKHNFSLFFSFSFHNASLSFSLSFSLKISLKSN